MSLSICRKHITIKIEMFLNYQHEEDVAQMLACLLSLNTPHLHFTNIIF